MNLNDTLSFLKKLKQNNNRDWFHQNKQPYEEAKDSFVTLIENVLTSLSHDEPYLQELAAKDCLFRINRDVRFSEDKSPYKTNFGAFIARGGRKSPYAGYYIHIEPGASFIGGGIYMPDKESLLAIRSFIRDNTKEFKEIVEDKRFKDTYGGLYGDKLVSVPRGFPKHIEGIEYIKHKHYAVTHHIEDSIWQSSEVLDYILSTFQVQRSFNEMLNKVLIATK